MHTHPYSHLVQEITGVPLVPEIITKLPLGPDTIRGFVCDALGKMVQDRFPKSDSNLNAEQIAELRQVPGIQQLGAELQAANDTLINWHLPPEMPPHTEGANTPRGIVQAKALLRQVEHSQQAPLYSNDPDSPYSDGLLIVGPTGIGKTVFQGLNLNYAGVGKPISAVLPERRKAVGILHSIDLLNQWLDPSETLQKFANVGGHTVRVGAYHGKQRNGHDEFDYLLTTPGSYEKAVAKGAIDLTTTVRFILDEAHLTALAPRIQRSINKWGQGLYMYTATPAIARGRRDLRRKFPHSQFGSLREYAEDGILSAAQLFSYRAGPEHLAEENLAIRLAVNMLESGRKTLIVCQPGEELKQARDIANEINRLYKNGAIKLPSSFNKIEGDRIACAIGGSVPSLNTPENLRLFKAGERLVMTSVVSGRDGLNIVDLEGLIIIGPWGAQWVIDQWLGRAMRPSGRPVVVSEIFPHVLHAGTRLASIFRSFDIEDGPIIAGYYVGPHPDDKPEGLPEVEPSNLLGRTMIRQVLGPQDSDTSNQTAPPELYTPSAELRAALIDNVSFREATIAPNLATSPPGYKPLEISLPKGVPIEWAYGVLSRLNDPAIRYAGIWEQDENGEKYFVRHYSPAAHEYFKNNPVPELASKTEFLPSEVAEMLGVTREYIMGIIADLAIQPVSRLTKQLKQMSFYNMDALVLIKQEVDKVPLAPETDVPVNELGEELGISGIHQFLRRYGIEDVDKRRNPLWGGRSIICKHVTEAEALFLREVRDSLQEADPKLHIGIAEITQRAGVSTATLWIRARSLPEDKQPLFEWMINRSINPALFTDRQYGEALIEYLKPEKLLPWEITMGFLCKYFVQPRRIIELRLDKLKAQGEHLLLPKTKGTVLTYPLSIIPSLIEAGLQPVKNAPRVTAELAALSPRDLGNEKQVAYSQYVQRHFLPEAYIPAPGEIAYYQKRREQLSTVPDAVLPDRPVPQPASAEPTPLQPPSPPTYSELSSKPAVDPTPPAPPAPPPPIPPASLAAPSDQRSQAVKASKPQFLAAQGSIEMPADYVNLRQFFQGEGVDCAHNLLLALARQQGINSKEWSFTNHGIFTSRSDATTLTLAILEYDIAPEPTGNPETDQVPAHRLVAEFSDKNARLVEGDVYKVAVRLLQQRGESMESVSTPFRERLPNGRGGVLMIHYKKQFADQVRKKLENLKSQKRLAEIRKW